MNRFWKALHISTLTLVLVVGSATVASAQTGGGSGGTGGGTGGGATTSDTRNDQGFNLGWLGLLGLAGLIPLFTRRNGSTVHHTGGTHGRGTA